MQKHNFSKSSDIDTVLSLCNAQYGLSRTSLFMNPDSSSSKVPAPHVSSPTGELPSIHDLLTQSWNVCSKSAGNLVILNIFSILIIWIIIPLLAFSVFYFSGGDKYIGTLLNYKHLTQASLIGFPITSFLISFILWIIGVMVGSTVSHAASMQLVYAVSNKEEQSISLALSKGFALFFPMFLVSLLSGLLVMGSLGLFIFPGIFVAFFLTFSSYAVVLDNKRGVGAIRQSVSLVSQHFGGIVLRLLLLMGLSFVIQGLFRVILSISPSLYIASFLMLVGVSYLLGLFGISYMVMLYKHVRSASDTTKQSSLAWIVVIAVLGWAMIGALGVVGNRFIHSDAYKKMVAQSKKSTSGTPITQLQADMLSLATFTQINSQRTRLGIPVIQEDENLCGYAERRLGQLADFGRFDDYKGFHEDYANPALYGIYFKNYSSLAEIDYSPINSLVSGYGIASYYAASKTLNAVTDPKITNGCVRATPKYLVFVAGVLKQATAAQSFTPQKTLSK